MRAMAIAEFGGPDKLRPMALARPAPEPGEVLVKVVAAGVNPVDCEIREGRLRDAFPHRFPLVLGWDVAGVVEGFGDGARRFRRGDKVWGYARRHEERFGAYADYAPVP
jgi:NADPH:quinone reductase-like Zn-dependent oxidoreductase